LDQHTERYEFLKFELNLNKSRKKDRDLFKSRGHWPETKHAAQHASTLVACSGPAKEPSQTGARPGLALPTRCWTGPLGAVHQRGQSSGAHMPLMTQHGQQRACGGQTRDLTAPTASPHIGTHARQHLKDRLALDKGGGREGQCSLAFKAARQWWSTARSGGALGGPA
jgi:hypothetical protein